MAVEIRELVIKTEIRTQQHSEAGLSPQVVSQLKYEMLEECRRMIQQAKHKKDKRR